MNKWYFSLGAVLISVSSAYQLQAQQATEQSSGTKIIVIEEKVDRWGNKTVTKTVKEGNFTDEEIEKIIAEESQTSNTQNAGHVEKGYLGVMIENVPGGVRITQVVEGSPAESAGLKAGDVVMAIGDSEVANMEALVHAVSSHKPGETIQVHYLRDGASATAPAVLAVREEPVISDVFEWDEHIEGIKEHEENMKEHEKEMQKHEEEMQLHEKMMKEHEEKFKEEKEKSKPRFGVSIDEIEDGNGVLVTHVYEGSLAERAGLQEGDVITTFNGIEVNTPDDLIEAVKSSPSDDKVKVSYLRDGKKMKEKVVFERT